MRYMKTFFPVFTIVLIYSLVLLMSSIPVAQGADDGFNIGWKWDKQPGEKPEWGVGGGIRISTGTLTDLWERLKGDDDDDTDSESCDSDEPDWAKDSGSCDSPPPSESSSDPESSSEDDGEEESSSGGDVKIENVGNVVGDDNEVENKITIKIRK